MELFTTVNDSYLQEVITSRMSTSEGNSIRIYTNVGIRKGQREDVINDGEGYEVQIL